MTDAVLLSVDGACSGKKAACAAVLTIGDRVVAEHSRSVSDVEGYALAAEIAAVGLCSHLLGDLGDGPVVVEVDNPDVPRVLREGYRPKQFARIPPKVLEAAIAFDRLVNPAYRVLPRNSTPGLRRADRLAGERLWRKRDARRR